MPEDEMTPEERAMYAAAMSGAQGAAQQSAAATQIARERAAFAAMTPAEQLRVASSGTDIASTPGVLGPDGKYYTDPNVTGAIQTAGINQPGPTLYRRFDELLTAGQTQEALALMQQYDPATYAMLTDKENQGVDFFNGQNMRGQDESWDALIARRFHAFEGFGYKNVDDRGMVGTEGTIGAGTLLDLATGQPISSTYNTVTGSPSGADIASVLTGAPVAALTEAGPAAVESFGNTPAPTSEDAKTWLRDFVDPGDIGLGDAVVGGLGGNPEGLPTVDELAGAVAGSTPGGGVPVATAPSAISRGDFEMARIDQPWVSPELQRLLASSSERAATYQGDAAPTITEGTPEQIARYNQAIDAQAGLVGDIRGAAGLQRALANEMAGTRNIYLDAAMGRAPSVAELQMQEGLTQAQKQALALARTARDPGAFYRAQRTQGNLANQAVNQTAMLRAKEQADARTGLTGYLGAESAARAATTQGAGTAAAAQQQITADQIARLAQQQGISVEQAKTQLQNQQQNNAMSINLANTANAAANTELQAKAGAAAENRAAGELGAQYAKTRAEAETSKYGTDVGAQTQLQIEEERSKRAKEAALLGGGAALLGSLIS